MDNDFKPSFGSDNHSGVHPVILKSIIEANTSHAPSYGTDSLSSQAELKFKELFGENTEAFFVFNGTAANVLSLKATTQSWESVLCSDVSHLNVDECGAPEAIAGVKLIPGKSINGKITPEILEPLITRTGDQHFSQVGVLSITQPTELGTVYSLEELKALRAFADRHNLKCHMDGSRLSNALLHLGCDYKEIINTFRPDALSFGGTKNGLLGCEAVLFWKSEYSKNFKYLRKQNLQLPSKMRFLSSQFISYFEDDLYLKIARHSCHMASLLGENLAQFKTVEVLYPVESNAVFITFPKQWTKQLKQEMFFYIWDSDQWSARLMTTFDTTEEDINRFCEKIRSLENGN